MEENNTSEGKPAKNPTLELAMANINKQFGDQSVLRLGKTDFDIWPSISTGSLALDAALGIGGLPEGRIVEVFGAESAGKTTVALSVVANAQKAGYTCAYIDVENAIDPNYAATLGVDLESLIFSQPSYGEAALEIVDRLIRTGEVKVIVVDSVAALVPKEELDGGVEKQQMSVQARMMSKAMRILSHAVNETGTLLLFINQIRHKVGVMYGNPETNPGGKALPYYASVRIDLRRKEEYKDKDGKLIGTTVKAKVIKNKMAPPLKIAEFDIIWGHGINVLGGIFDAAVLKGIINKKGGWYYYNEELMAQGRDKCVEVLASDMELAEEIRGLVLNGS